MKKKTKKKEYQIKGNKQNLKKNMYNKWTNNG